MGDTAQHAPDTVATGVEVGDVDRVLADKTLLGRSGFSSGSELYEPDEKPDRPRRALSASTRSTFTSTPVATVSGACRAVSPIAPS